jgi:hypothetical protein
MAEQNLFFRWTYRLLAIGGLCLLLAIAYFWIAGTISSHRWRDRNTVEVAQTGQGGQVRTQKLRFGDLEAIRGSATQMLKVESEDESGKRVGFSSGGYGANFTIRNLIFLEPGNGAARWLFDNNRFIGKTEKICKCNGDDQSPVLAIYLEVAEDRTGNAEAETRVLPALTRADGRGYTELGKSVSRVLDNTLSDDGKTFGLLVEDQGKLLYRQFSMESFALLSETTLTQLRRN